MKPRNNNTITTYLIEAIEKVHRVRFKFYRLYSARVISGITMQKKDNCILDSILPLTWTNHLIFWGLTPHQVKSLELVTRALTMLRPSISMTPSHSEGLGLPCRWRLCEWVRLAHSSLIPLATDDRDAI